MEKDAATRRCDDATQRNDYCGASPLVPASDVTRHHDCSLQLQVRTQQGRSIRRSVLAVAIALYGAIIGSLLIVTDDALLTYCRRL